MRHSDDRFLLKETFTRQIGKSALSSGRYTLLSSRLRERSCTALVDPKRPVVALNQVSYWENMMASILQTFLVSCAAICVVVPRWGTAEECAYDFAAELSIQVLNRSTQIPINDDQNNWNGSLYVREGWLMDVELGGYRVDLRFRDIDKQSYEISVVVQERTGPPDSSQMPGMYHHRNATYDQLNPKALKFKGTFGKPLVIRPDIADVTLALTLYSYPRDA